MFTHFVKKENVMWPQVTKMLKRGVFALLLGGREEVGGGWGKADKNKTNKNHHQQQNNW